MPVWTISSFATHPAASHLLLALFFTWISVSSALDNGLALVPPMGWNSWNTFHCNTSQALIVQAAHTIKKLGLDKVGYVYVNLDDCWMAKSRTLQGRLTGDPTRFPNGMKWLGDYLHNLGLKFGIYSAAGDHTCAGFPASLTHEIEDAGSFASWGVDYLKYDNCGNHQDLSAIDRHAAMRNALNFTGRPILFSVCQKTSEQAWQWGPTIGNTWRITNDIEPWWAAVKTCFWQSQQHSERAQPGAWQEPDMLEVGNGNLTLAENRAHFSLWVMAKASLLLGNDLNNMSESVLDIISNQNLIEIHQDPNTPQATCVVGCNKQDPPNTTPSKNNKNKSQSHAATRSDENDDYSMFATRRGGGRNIVVALIMNWHDTKTLELGTINAVQLLGVAPFPAERVVVRDLWTNENVTMLGNEEQDTQDDDDDHDDDIADHDHFFDFAALKTVPIPPIAPHDCIVYSFSHHVPVQRQQEVEERMQQQ